MQEIAAIKIIKNRLEHHFPNIKLYVEISCLGEVFILVDDRKIYDSNEFLAEIERINREILWSNHGLCHIYFAIKYKSDKDAIPIEEYINVNLNN